MKSPRLTRRQLFKASALGAGAFALPVIGLASIAAGPSREAQAAAEQPDGPAIPQPTFNPIASSTTFGPLADISMGWDGTLWGIDAQGAPHVYDSVNDIWAQHGDGIDAAAQMGDLLYFFKGDSFVTASQRALLQTSAPKTIASQWSNLPKSFHNNVMGAANFNDKGLILFNGGRFVSTDGSIPLTSLISLTNWPQTPQWKDGVIDAVYANQVGWGIVLIRGSQWISIDPVQKAVTQQPAPFSALPVLGQYLPVAWQTSGFDAMTVAGEYQIAFKGTGVTIFSTDYNPPADPPSYIPSKFPGWPTTWHPTLRHAPNGRDGNLWSVLPQAQGGWIMHHDDDGDGWTQVNNQADHVGVGQDNAVMIASAQRLWRFTGAFDGSGFDPVSPESNLVQVSLGNAGAVFARDSSNSVYSFDPSTNSLTQSPTVGAAAHIAATADGTLWHCKPGNPNAYRFLSDSNLVQPAIPVKNGLVSAVVKVAAAGFGASHCLAQANNGSTYAYRYDSPYVFKSQDACTATRGQIIAQGLGRVYFTDTSPDALGVSAARVIALDAHTGVTLSRSATLPGASPVTYGAPVFDMANSLIYVATRVPNDVQNTTTTGQLLALDARDLSKVVWSFSAPASIDATPALINDTLLFGDRLGNLYAFDTRATKANPATPTPTHSWNLPAALGIGALFCISTPVLVDQNYVTALWVLPLPGDADQTCAIYRVTVAPSSTNLSAGDVVRIFQPGTLDNLTQVVDMYQLLSPPLVARFASSATATMVMDQLFINGGNAIVLVNGSTSTVSTFPLPVGSVVSTGLAWDADEQQIWFGDNQGVLYGLNTRLSPVGHTPISIGDAPSRAFATPIVYLDPQGGKTILLGVSENDNLGSLYGFDPTSGNLASIGTGVTQITALSANVTNGVLYAAGAFSGVGPTLIPQAFGIRVNTVTQGQRDFIIESQLMQDPDPTATNGSADPNTLTPPSAKRYQTHITIVDDQKTPMPFEALKIWADLPNTVISIEGVQYNIGPDDASFAIAQTGSDGCVVITSEATDVNASTLRAWASFMNPYERIVVYPDHEFHERVSNANSDPTGVVGKPDPNAPNLRTVHNYTGVQLFTADQVNKGDPDNIANAIRQMKSGVNPAPATAVSLAGALKTLHASNPASQYTAYSNLAGMHYGPNNARAKRTLTIANPIGLHLSLDPTTGKSVYTPMHHADARDAIDALTGNAWDPSNPNGPGIPLTAGQAVPAYTFVVRRSHASDDATGGTSLGGASSIFTDFWNWLKGVVARIEQVIVSAAEDVLVAIKTSLGTVFRAVIKVLDDICPVLGSFFKLLEKLINDVIEALSALLHFGEVKWTHIWLRDQINTQVQTVKNAMVNQVKTGVDAFFTAGEDAIKTQFDKLRQQLDPNKSINNVQGMGSTAHTAMTAGPGSAGRVSGSSQAVQSSWGLQKLKSGLPSASEPSAATARSAPTQTSDAISDFVNTFVSSISEGGDLNAAWTQLKSDISRLFSPGSAKQFFSTLLDTLLDILETLLIGMLAVGKAFLDGILAVINNVIDLVMDILNAEIDIPVISWLYETLFGEKLTMLNAVTLIAAIPVTIIYRVATGDYPQDDLQSVQSATRIHPQHAEIAPAIVRRVLGAFAAFLFVAYGFVNAIGDSVEDAPPIVGKASVGIGLVIQLVTAPVIGSDSVSPLDWGVYGVDVVISVLATLGLPVIGLDVADAPLLSFVLSILSATLLAITIYAFIQDGSTDANSDIAFADGIIGTLPGIINPLKFAPSLDIAALIVAGVDVVAGFALCALNLWLAFTTTTHVPSIHRLHFPWVAFNPAAAWAEPHPLVLHSTTP